MSESGAPRSEGDIAIASGFDRFPLLIAAAEMADAGRLAGCLAGFYPTAIWQDSLERSGMAQIDRVRRLFDRGSGLPDDYVLAQPMRELQAAVGDRLRCEGSVIAARHGFARKAARLLHTRLKTARLYHYRTGFGHAGAARARRLGLVTLAHHSIAHPALLEHLVRAEGRLPSADGTGPDAPIAPLISPLWEDVRRDLRHADHVLVNSDFVKQTFLHQGWDPERVHVIYQGVDRRFFEALPERDPAPAEGPLRLAFAGRFERRKGVDQLVSALAGSRIIIS
jgi:glycosyltransferase involved in cell wall biosynthesis